MRRWKPHCFEPLVAVEAVSSSQPVSWALKLVVNVPAVLELQDQKLQTETSRIGLASRTYKLHQRCGRWLSIILQAKLQCTTSSAHHYICV